MFKNMASALFLTERDAEFDANKPKVKGRIITTIEKAKEVRSLVEKCITLARKMVPLKAEADKLNSPAERGSDAWKNWRKGEGWQKWAKAMSPVLAGRRRLLQMLGDKQAVKLCVEELGPRFLDRKGGYTRVLRLAKPRLGDAGTRAILEFVGKNDRVVKKAQKPTFTDEPAN